MRNLCGLPAKGLVLVPATARAPISGSPVFHVSPAYSSIILSNQHFVGKCCATARLAQSY